MLRSIFALVLLSVSACTSTELTSKEQAARWMHSALEQQLVPARDFLSCDIMTRYAVEQAFAEGAQSSQLRQNTLTLRELGCIDGFSSVSLVAGQTTTAPDPDVLAGKQNPPSGASAQPKPTTSIVYLRPGEIDQLGAEMIEGALNRFYETLGVFPRHVILDLRNNPGGSTQWTGVILQLFAPRNGIEMFRLRQRDGALTIMLADAGKFAAVPVTVLINGKTASAAEIVAGVLQEWGATVIGKKSYGKGVYQTTATFDQRVRLLVTRGEVFLGEHHRSYHNTGIFPSRGMEVVNAEVAQQLQEDETFRRALTRIKTGM